jgi:hypothetical protein
MHEYMHNRGGLPAALAGACFKKIPKCSWLSLQIALLEITEQMLH